MKPGLAQTLGVLAFTLILFAGGADTDWRSVRPAVWEALALSTLGVFATAVTLAAIVSSTVAIVGPAISLGLAVLCRPFAAA